MTQLETVRGAAGGESSGQVLMHELFTLGAEVRQKYPDPWDEDHHPEEPMQFHFTGPGPVFYVPEPMVELFMNDIREGIAETGVKAGLLK